MKISLPGLILSIFCILTSCENKLLDPREDNQQLIERVLRDPVYAEGFLHSAYKHLPSEYQFSSTATDDAVSNAKSNPYRRMATGEWSPLFSPVSVWDNAYAAIFHLNFLLSVVDDVEWSWQSTERNKLFIKKNSGEAYALRGYFYLQLLRHHGGIASDGQLLGVPLVTKPLEVDDGWQIPRASFHEVVDQINADFDKALELLPYTWNSDYSDEALLRVMGVQNEGRIQGKIVTALKSQIALLAASPAYHEGGYDRAGVESAAHLTAPLLVELGGIDGLPPDRIFYDEDDDIKNPDIFWRTDHGNVNNREMLHFPPSLFGQGNLNPTQNLVDAFPMKNGYPVEHELSGYAPADPYSGRDQRLEQSIIVNGTEFKGDTINVSLNSDTDDGLNKTVNSTRTGYYLKKLLRSDVNLDPAVQSERRHFYTHIRYTELYLNFAEAANEAWGPDGDPEGYGFTVRDVIAQIRQRAGIDQPDEYLNSVQSKEELRELIRTERRLELCFEGHRFWDLRRWTDPLDVPAEGVAINESEYDIIEVEKRIYPVPQAWYGPIPQDEINKNELIIQNQGW